MSAAPLPGLARLQPRSNRAELGAGPQPFRPRTRADAPERVLIVTGGMLSPRDGSLLGVLKRQTAAVRSSSGAWLDVQIKLLALEEILARGSYQRSRAFRRAPFRGAVERFFADDVELASPELTEVALATLLAREGVEFHVTTFSELASDAQRREWLLARSGAVFASTTLLRDLSEVEPILAMLERPHLRVVLGGALAGIVHAEWPGHPSVDVLAVGYGERLVPALVRWIRAGYGTLEAPAGGRLTFRGSTALLFSGVPASRSLDDLPTPDWSLAERVHGRRFPLVHYESVRGCPYRCGFCNYPYLFDDTKFRSKSAERIAEDWAAYRAAGAEYVSCLDSLFTMPRQRLEALCRLLVTQKIGLKWLCYARADDLCEPSIVAMMREAGCVQVQVGIESGDQGQLDRMNKRCTVEKNGRALSNCREAGLTTAATVILGYPGETQRSLENTLAFLAATPPDFTFVAPFNARVEHVPVLSPESRLLHRIELANDGHSSQPYWRHRTMSCSDVGKAYRWMNRALMERRISLHAGVFYRGMLRFDPRDRDALLDFQRAAVEHAGLIEGLFSPLHRWTERKLRADVARALGPEPLDDGAKPPLTAR